MYLGLKLDIEKQNMILRYDTSAEKLDILACEQYPYEFNRSEFDTFENIKNAELKEAFKLGYKIEYYKAKQK